MTNNFDFQSFYEGRFVRTKDFRFPGKGLLRRVYRAVAADYSTRRAQFLKKHLTGRNNTILDLGCGGGTLLFAEHGTVFGTDLSMASLRAARSIYATALSSDIGRLPFKDGFFDYVVSIDVLGHIPVDQKDRVLQEIKRVLKPTGKSIHAAIETDGCDRLSRLVKRWPEQYRAEFIDKHGHFGYEYPGEVVKRFERNGFKVIERAKMQGGVFVDPWFYVEWFYQSEYSRHSLALRAAARLFWIIFAADRRLFRGKGVLVAPFKFVLGLINLLADRLLLSFDHSRGIAVCVAKQPDANGLDLQY